MATRNYNVGSGYQLIVGNFFQNNDLEITGNGSNASVVIESAQIQGINIPTTLTGNVTGAGVTGGFLATLINNGISFVGSAGHETFDASKYIGDVKFNGAGGTNTLKGAAGSNLFTHDYANNGLDNIYGGQDHTVYWKKFIIFGPTQSKTHYADNELVVNGDDNANLFRFKGDGDQFQVFKDASNVAINAYNFDDGKVIVNGGKGNDTADVKEHEGIIKFFGGDGDDTLAFQHGTSGAGTKFYGEAGTDTLVVHAQSSGSELAVNNSTLATINPTVLVELSSVDKVVFHGSSNVDIFDASAFTGKSVLNGGNGADVLKASTGGSEITGGNGADDIFLGAGADRVIYDANGQSTLANLDEVHNFNTSADDLVFSYGNKVQSNQTLFYIPIVGSEIRFNDGIVEYRATQLSAWKTDLEDLSIGNWGINSLATAASAVAWAAADNRIAAFEYDENWYVIEAGSGSNVDNLIHLVGTTLNTSSNVNNFVDFLPA